MKGMARGGPFQTSQNHSCPSEDVLENIKGVEPSCRVPAFVPAFIPLSLQHLWVYLFLSPGPSVPPPVP